MFRIKVDQGAINKLKAEIAKEWEAQVLDKMIAICDKAIEQQWVKFRPIGYNDQTGQLRSSTGYIIYHKGKVVKDRFELSSYGTDKAPGWKEGREYAFSKLRESQGWGILFVAGKDYASYVEAKNYSVLRDAEMVIKEDLFDALDGMIVR